MYPAFEAHRRAFIMLSHVVLKHINGDAAGGGKSMTYQLPALAKGNCFTVVVGPLMALAKDQVLSDPDYQWYHVLLA